MLRSYSLFSPWTFKKSLPIELFDFFESLAINPPTKSAFVQARDKIRPLFFQDLFRLSTKLFYRHFSVQRWNGFRIWACDGTGLRLPDEVPIGNHFGWHKNQHSTVPSTRILCFFDVLNQLIADIYLHPRQFAERAILRPLIEHIPKNVIMIYDRGFAGYAIPFLHQLYGSNCVVRLTATFNPTVVKFIQSGKRQLLVKSTMTERATRSLRKLGHKVSRNDTIQYRLIRVDLPNNEVEVLLTTLLNTRKWPASQFKQLYNLRWGGRNLFSYHQIIFPGCCIFFL